MDKRELFPAHAGVIRTRQSLLTTSYPFPRIRGGDPGYSPYALFVGSFSPHMRG